MKKLYFILLLFTGYIGFAFSPPVIQTPTTYYVCDVNNDQFETFDLTTKTPEILGALDPTLYMVMYFETPADAANGTNFIFNPTAFSNISPVQTIYVRVVENANPANFALTSFALGFVSLPTATIMSQPTACSGYPVLYTLMGANGTAPYVFSVSVNGGPINNVWTIGLNYTEVQILDATPGGYDIALTMVQSSGSPGCSQILNETAHIDVLPTPTPSQPQDLSIEQIPYIGTALFDLTFNDALLHNGDPNVSITYHLTEFDAQAATIPIFETTAFSATNGQVIWARVQNAANQCAAIVSFHLYITNPDVIFIPDANFKAQLIALGVDTNVDGEIQINEALVPTSLNVSNSNISDLTGIQYFTNLTQLNCSANNLSVLDLLLLTNLLSLDCSNNNLTTLDVGNLTNLTSLNVVNNQLTEIVDLDLLVNLDFLSLYQNQISDLNVDSLVNLTSLNTGNNPLGTLNVSQNTNLTYLFCPQNMLTSIDITSLTNLQFFYCYANQISSLDTTNNTALIFLYCNENQISSLDVSNLHSLTNLDCSSNLITALNVSGTNMSTLKCSYNPLPILDLSGLTGINHLAELYCNGTNLTTLDLAIADQNIILECNNNIQLTSLYMKNGSLQQNVSIGGDQNLSFICVDDDNELLFFRALANSYGYTDCVINSYCSFMPGGDFNTITGTATFDANNNGCDVLDLVRPNIRMNINDGTNAGASFTDNSGNYTFYTQTGSFTITPNIENPTWFNFSPAVATIPFADNNNNIINQNFCIAANGAHHDVEMVIVPIIRARPGFDAVYDLVYKNKGNQTETVFLNFNYDDTRLQYVSSSASPSVSSVDGHYGWQVSNVQPFQSGSIRVTLHVNTPTDIPPVNIDDVLIFTSFVDITSDENWSDNSFTYNQTVVGSFDPNDITCIEGNVLAPSEIGKYLHYVINFENTGTAEAENIVVKDIIDTTQFDVNSLQVLNSSASVTSKLTGNIAEFIFRNINLHSGGHGNILIKVRSKNTLVQGNTVSKRANIYFDYNAPIDTNLENTIFQALNNPDFEVDASISVYPNPTKGNLNIKCDNTIKSVQLFDIQGRILQTNLVNENQTNIDISSHSKGVYFIKVLSDKGISVQKIVKE
ncbi:MAG: T9SS type A sorting domain-containing protein [Flavobacterium sp.]|uniref:T9SS type A sorting domain-containing protein n=1 Tax=Flavobacterium sp. TaxID=239 RepID=UPI003264203E